MNIKNLGFIGLGVMGRSMVKNLMSAGFQMTVYNRTKASSKELTDAGAKWADTPKEVAQNCDVIITMVGYPQDVEQVYFAPNGLFEAMRPGAILIDMTTSSPSLAVKIAQKASQLGGSAIDAPVSGGDVGAKNATLSIMAGGDHKAFDTVLPILQAMGKSVRLMGNAGSGQHTKMANQIAIASNMMGVCEALTYAKGAGLPLEDVQQVISAGAAGSFSLSVLAPRMINGDFAPGFYVKHFIKDMKIALDSAKEMGLNLPGLALAESLYEKLASEGCQDDGTQALFKLYEEQNL